jgi:hypothetical protein
MAVVGVPLSSVTTEQWNGSKYVEADSWALSQNFPPPGDGTSPTLFLDSITHTGADTAGGGTAVKLPAVTFNWETSAGVAIGQLANRVNPGNYPALVRFRIVIPILGAFTPQLTSVSMPWDRGPVSQTTQTFQWQASITCNVCNF